tara:strand:+ start:394 stop:582 length:189 start_codon:yes stop_codon:yes gene_type:complete
MSDKQQQFDFVGKDAIKKLIKDAIDDTTRPKINFQILDTKKTKALKVEEVILPTHLTIGDEP